MTTGGKALLGSALLVGEGLINKTVGLISTLILARLLAPDDFGLVAIGVLLMGFVEILTKTDGMQYLIRSEKVTRDDLDTYWTLNLYLNSGLAGLFFLSAPLAAAYYGDERLISIIYFLCVQIVIQSLRSPSEAYLFRNHQYLPLAKVSIASKIAAVIVSASTAILFKTYWALLLGQFAHVVVSVIGTYIVAPYLPRLTLVNVKSQWSFSAWAIPQSVMGYLRTQLDTLIVSANYGKDMLGSYHVLKYLSYIPSANVIVPATQPLLVELAQLKSDKKAFSLQFNVSFIAVMILAVPIASIMITHHELIVHSFLGDQWVKFSPLLGSFALLVIATAMQQQANRVLIVHANTKHIFFYELVSFTCLYSVIFICDFDNLYTFTYLRVTIESIFALAYMSVISIKHTSLGNYLRLLIATLPIVASSIIGGYSSLLITDVSRYSIVNLALASAIFMLTFIASLIGFYWLFMRENEEWRFLKGKTMQISQRLPFVSRLKLHLLTKFEK